MNAFRMTASGGLDRVYLRTCAIWRLLKAGRITAADARALANRPIRQCYRKAGWLDATISIWANVLRRRA